jgi:cytochrome c553
VTRRAGPRAGWPPSACAAALVLLAVLALAAPSLAQTFEERVVLCQACHGPTGQSTIPETPSIGGHPQFFVVTQLFLFKEGRRSNEAMTAVTKGFTNDDLRLFSAWVSKLPAPPPPTEAVDASLFARGRTVAGRHPCRICHNPDFSGREQMPRLAHQREEYLLKVMREYQKGTRIGYAGAMSTELQGLSDDDLRALAHFFSHFKPE